MGESIDTHRTRGVRFVADPLARMADRIGSVIRALVPVLALAEAAGLARLAGQQLTVPTDKGANAGRKVASLVAGMVAGADSIDDLGLLRHGGLGRVFSGAYAPSSVWDRSCGPSGSDMSASSTRSLPAS